MKAATEQPSRKPLLPLADAQGIAEKIVGAVEWQGAAGWCRCPGLEQHRTRNGRTHCKVVCAPMPLARGTLPPGVYCHHGSCAAEVKAASFALRSALGRRTVAHRRRPRPARFVIPERPPEPVFDPDKLARVAARLPEVDEAWLAARSDYWGDCDSPATFLHPLYEPGEKVVVFDVFESQGQAVWTQPGDKFLVEQADLSLDHFRTGRERGVWFLNNPVTGEYAPNDQGTPSRRSWQNVTAWRYLVLESDEAEAAHWLSALAQLPMAIAAIYTSGGRSIHALVRVDAGSKEDWDSKVREWVPLVVPLGADRKAMTAVRLTRLPGCERREKRGRQRLLYLRAHPSRTPICQQEAWQ